MLATAALDVLAIALNSDLSFGAISFRGEHERFTIALAFAIFSGQINHVLYALVGIAFGQKAAFFSGNCCYTRIKHGTNLSHRKSKARIISIFFRD